MPSSSLPTKMASTATASTSKPKGSNKPASQCDFCEMSFKKLEHLQRHMRTHTQDRPYSCVAPGCGKAFARQDTLNRHARLHVRDAEEGAKGRAPRRRTKSISESSTGSAGRRSSTSPYPNTTARRESDASSSAASIAARNSVRGFNVLSTTIPEHATAQAFIPPPAPASIAASSSRFSTMDLLGISYSDSTSPVDDLSPLPALNELYGTQSLDGAHSFPRDVPRHTQIFQQSSSFAAQPSLQLQTHQLDFASPPASAASPWSDDSLSVSSNEHTRTPSLAHSSALSSLSSSYDTTLTNASPMLNTFPRLATSYESPMIGGHSILPGYESKMPGTDAYSSTDLML